MSWAAWSAKNKTDTDWSKFDEWKEAFFRAWAVEEGYDYVAISDSRLKAFYQSSKSYRDDPYCAAYRGTTHFAKEIIRGKAWLELQFNENANDPTEKQLDAYYKRMALEEVKAELQAKETA